MIEETVVIGYAQALFELADSKDSVEEVQQDLDGIKELLKIEKFRSVLYHPSITKDKKKGLINNTIGPQCSKLVKNLIFILIDRRKEKFLDYLTDIFKEVSRQARGISLVKVQTVVPLSDEKLKKLKENLGKLIKRKIDLETEINESLIGGMVIKIGNKIIDGSIVSHLRNLKNNLLRTTLA